MEIFMIFGEVCTLGELANNIEKKLQPKYDKIYGTGVVSFFVTRVNQHSISFTWKRNLNLPKKKVIGISDAEIITGHEVSNSKPLEFFDCSPKSIRQGTVLIRSFIPRYKKMMRKRYKLDRNKYDIDVTANDTELNMTITFVPLHGIVYRYSNLVKGNEYGWSYIGETMDEKNRKRNWRKTDDKYANARLTEAKRKWGVNNWTYHVLESVDKYYDVEDLKAKLYELEEAYIDKYNTIVEGYNESKGGTGNKGRNFSQTHRAKIGAASLGRTHTAATKAKISASNKGRVLSLKTKQKISMGNLGKKRTDEMKKAQSDRQKGIVPQAATDAAKEWVKTNGAYWKNHPIPQSMKDNMKAAQQKRGRAVEAIAPDGTRTKYNTMNDAANALNMKAGSIHNNLKSGGVCNNGYKFREIPKIA